MPRRATPQDYGSLSVLSRQALAIRPGASWPGPAMKIMRLRWMEVSSGRAWFPITEQAWRHVRLHQRASRKRVVRRGKPVRPTNSLPPAIGHPSGPGAQPAEPLCLATITRVMRHQDCHRARGDTHRQAVRPTGQHDRNLCTHDDRGGICARQEGELLGEHVCRSPGPAR